MINADKNNLMHVCMDLTKRIHQYTRGAWTFDVIDSGPIDAPLVVLLHGFPETAHSGGADFGIIA